MFSWPQLPSISLPATIQRRFLSFVLKRSLGHLVRPGQLDPAQIDAQIGSGFVQVNNVQLDYDVINKHLNDLPVPFRLEDGSIGKISVRIPWPNLLSAPFALSLSSLCLTFVIVPRAKKGNHHMHATDELAESVASVAESFIHDELSEKDDQSLRDILPFEPHPQRQPPGSIDPFLSTEDLDAGRYAQGYDQGEENEDHSAPSTQGVSLLATLIERLLARFEFDASDTTLRFVLPEKAELIVRLGMLTYSTVNPTEDSGTPVEKANDDGELRTVRASGLTVSIRDLTPLSPPSSNIRGRSASPSTSSSSSEDEHESVMMMMSQSLASLPPAPSPYTISPGSSMYHSATSSVRHPSPEPLPTSENREPVEEQILSLGTDSEPVVLTLVTPPLLVPEVQVGSADQGHTNLSSKFRLSSTDQIRLTLAVGPVAVALNTVHVRSIYHLSSALAMPRSIEMEPKPLQTSSTNPFDFALHVKSISFLLWQSSSPAPVPGNTSDQLHHFFHARSVPSPSPRIPHLRIQLETIEILRMSLTVSASVPRGTSPASALNLGASKYRVKASLDELSVFTFFSRVHETGESWIASPVLISDPNLASQYVLDDDRFPMFDVTDWTNGRAAKVSQWRVRPRHTKRRSSGGIPSPTTGSSMATHVPVMKLRMNSGALGQDVMCEADVVPLHLFVDVGLMDGALEFLSAATPTTTFPEETSRNEDTDREIEDTPPATPRAREGASWDDDERLRERERLETLIIDDFPEHYANLPAASNSEINFVLRIALFRIQLRAPPPVTWASRPRSGALVIDIHRLQVMRQEKESAAQGHTARFEPLASRVVPKVLGLVEFKALVTGATLPGDTTVTTFLSMMSLQLPASDNSSSAFRTIPTVHTHLPSSVSLPSLCLRSNRTLPHRPSTTTASGAASSFSLDAQLPSVHVKVSKLVFDDLIFLADDIVQSFVGDSERVATSEASGRSRDPSLIGSRFFAKRTASTGSSDSGAEVRKSEVIAKVSVAEARIILLVPKKNDNGKTRSMEISASDIDFLAEIKPEGKDETVVTVGVMDLGVSNTSASEDTVIILGLTTPRLLNPSSKSPLKLRFTSVVDSDTAAKESRLKITASGFTYLFTPEHDWVVDLNFFVKPPEGAFESVVPSERTKVAVRVRDCSFRLLARESSGALVAYIGELDSSTDLIGDSPEALINTEIQSACFLFIDNVAASPGAKELDAIARHGIELWKHAGYAPIAELDDFRMRLQIPNHPSTNTQVHINSVKLNLHACADTLPALGSFVSNLGSAFDNPDEKPSLPKRPTATSRNPHPRQKRDVFASVDENAFRRIPELGPAPDMIYDDLPTNLDYLDVSFGAAAGLREVRDEDLFDFEQEDVNSAGNTPTPASGIEGVIENFGGETIRLLDPQGIRVVEGHFENIPPEAVDVTYGNSETKLTIRIRNCDLTVSLHDGYDWVRTRKVIEDEVKTIRRRLVKIRQLLASGQVPDDSIEETSAILFNSVYVGLPEDPDELEPGALIAAIDQELNDDGETETGSQSSWQSFKRKSEHTNPRATRVRGKKLTRSRSSRIDFCFTDIEAEIDQFSSETPLVSKVLVTVKDLEILDHIKTSTWKKFLTELRTDFKGNIRETASDMVRMELRIVHPVPELPTEEGRLRAKVLPIKLHVDQDALDFMKKFFSFETPDVPVTPAPPKQELYFQHVEVFPVDIKLDYKPKRVDYKALREGKTIELMNFFHFDGAEITLRHITLSGITGWPRLFETLNDLWTPDVKANQLADIISGVSPVRSLVNVGSGVADLVLLPIAQYKKDKRVVRGVQKGTTSFVKSTAMEAIKLGARLATGTQVILEQAESVLGGQGQFRDTVTAEALQTPVFVHSESSDEESEATEPISKYADQPLDVREGMQTAYKSLAKNFNSAAQTILAVPMEVYERSGNEGPVRAVVRAVPIAVLKPMIGASEAVSKTLFGLRNTMDPEVRHENEAKYKHR